MGSNVDRSINDGRGPYCFKIHGQVYHRIGLLIPYGNDRPLFSQIYVYDTEHELSNRYSSFSYENDHGQLHMSLVQSLCEMVSQHNPYDSAFRQVRSWLPNDQVPNVCMCLTASRNNHDTQLSFHHLMKLMSCRW